MIWVLQVCGKMSVGGVQKMLMSYYENIDLAKVQFAFAVQRNYPYSYDDQILKQGGRIHYLPDMKKNPIKFKRELKKLLAEHPEYNIVHAHYNFQNWKILQIAKKSGVKYRISHAHAANLKTRITSIIHLGMLSRKIMINYNLRYACSELAGK